MLPEPSNMMFPSLLNDIEKGQIKIPQFQREFVWEFKKCASLMDSIVKGYPIGTLIFWKTKERLRSIRNIGGCALPEPPRGDFIEYVLDGQQRLTALFASLKGLNVERDNDRCDNFSEMYIDLIAGEADQIVITDTSGKDPKAIIKIHDLLYGGLTELTKYPKKFHKKLENYKKQINSYNYSIIQIREAPIDVATEIFTRINVGGKALSVFEIMAAKTYDKPKDFDLSEKFDRFIDDVRPHDYETIPRSTVLQTISLLLKKECKKQTILNLNKADFITTWPRAIAAIEMAIEFFRNAYRIPVSQLLPYNALVVPFAYFFFHHPKNPTGDKQNYLQDFFWRCALSGRYSFGLEGKLAQDILRVDKILSGERPAYDWPVNISPQFIKQNGLFSAGRSFVKAILCIYTYQQPKSFNTGVDVNISNYWLRQANSKNYHHFFPKSYMKSLSRENEANSILNITIVDDFLNKREIKDKSPSQYMGKFKDDNKHLSVVMKSHLINDLDKFGVWSNNFDKFLEQRSKAVSQELEKRIIPQEIDRQAQPIRSDDYDQDSFEVMDPRG